MAPNVEATGSPKYCNDEEIVISGLSGRLPHCETFEEFKQKLFKGTDILAEGESRWPEGKLLSLFLLNYDFATTNGKQIYFT